MADAGLEPVEVVDRAGRVLDVVTRERMRRERLRHRCTYVAVLAGPVGLIADAARPLIDRSTPLVVHQRADWKDTYPSYWDVAFGGVCGVGEPWEVAAARELAEEAGIVGVSLHDLGPVTYEQPENRIVGRAYVTAWPSEPDCRDGEVVAVDRIPIGDLASWSNTVDLCPDSAEVVTPLLLDLI